jgi:hypothetical protein
MNDIGHQDFAVPGVIAETEIGVRTPLLSGIAGGVYTPTPTGEMYVPLLTGFDHFNLEIFGNELTPCLLTVRAKGRTIGFYRPKGFAAVKGGGIVDEIAMNPKYFRHFSINTASTLAHEMVHHWQEHFGKPPRSGYHNHEWAAKMISIGLMPSDTGAVGGKQTGYHMSDYIIEGGPFARSFERLEATGWRLAWGDGEGAWGDGGGEGSEGEGAVEKPKKRVTFICSVCGRQAQAPASMGSFTHNSDGGLMTIRTVP